MGYSLQSKPPDGYDIAAFCRQVFAMYDGQLCIVELQCENSLMKAIIDRFGADVPTRIADCAHFIATVEVSVSPPFMHGYLPMAVRYKSYRRSQYGGNIPKG